MKFIHLAEQKIADIITEAIKNFSIKEAFYNWLLKHGKIGRLTSQRTIINDKNFSKLIYNKINNVKSLNNILSEMYEDDVDYLFEEILLECCEYDEEEILFSDYYNLENFTNALNFSQDQKSLLYEKLALYFTKKFGNPFTIENGMVYVEREISISSPNQLKEYKTLGTYWSYSKGGGKAYEGYIGETILIQGQVPIENVDIEDLIIRDNWSCSDEEEIRLYDLVQVNSFTYKEEKITLDKPILIQA